MKFIVDAQLPASLDDIFTGHDLIHTQNLLLGNKTSDNEINTLSVNEERILITKDSDFYYSYIAHKKPYKLILVRLGNVRIRELREYFRINASKILELIAENSFHLLEKGCIRIMD